MDIMANKQTSEGKRKKFEWTYIEFIFCLVTVSIVFIPLLLTRNFGLPAFTTTGQIGDTIGGTTAPVIGLLSAWLVYRALKAQIDANEIITDQFREQKKDDEAKKVLSHLFEQIKFLREDIKDFKFTFIDVSNDYAASKYQGIEAISAALDSFPTSHIEEKHVLDNHLSGIREIEYFLANMIYVIASVERYELDVLDRTHLLRIVGEIFHTKLAPYILRNNYKIASEQPKCRTCNEIHGIPDQFFALYHEVLAESLLYGFN
jgi:hypothetical protein